VEFGSPQFWIAVLQIIAIDILLGGDNAVVIALACRNLPEKQRKLGIIWGVAGAISLRVVLTIFAVALLTIPYLKIVGAILLGWIAFKLVMPHEEEGHGDVNASTSLVGAIKTIIIADLVMSLDNVIAVAGAAKDSWALIVFGLLVSIPIIVYCSTIILKLMDRFPWIIILGGGLLGWISGGMAIHDIVVKDWVSTNMPWAEYVIPALCAALVMAVGWWLARKASQAAPELVELASPPAADKPH
jgi:YjbE family integral membrane protein